MKANQAQIFETEVYSKLNEAQKEAVNHIEGPVMVLAGPGTGKTQIIAARIANILLSTDAQPKDILCITYTDAGVQAMRKRLLQFIGTAAYEVNIYTYHSFCSDIIRRYPQFFGNKNLEPATELQQYQIIEEILMSLPPENELRIFSDSSLNKIKVLKNFFSTCKDELFTEEKIEIACKQYEEEIYLDEDYFYKKASGKNKKGDPKQKEINAQLNKLQKLKEAIKLLPIFNQKMLAKGLFDFSDMLQWVNEAFEKNDELLGLVQPNFLYILVDEFQDNNAIQTNILNKLLADVESPNIFVVGDDDQSIYQFQGARLKNISDYVQKYIDDIKLIVLTQNYRSSQHILNAAKTVIENNHQRLTVQLPQLKLNKNLIASNTNYNALAIKPCIVAYENSTQEAVAIALAIEEKYKAGEPLHEIAVLYKNHKHASILVNLLHKKNVPYSLAKSVNVLAEPQVKQVLQILKYINAEAEEPNKGEYLLFEILHFYCFNLNALDVAKMSTYLKDSYADKTLTWRSCISNEAFLQTLFLSNCNAFLEASKAIEKWISAYHNLSLPMLLHDILFDAKIIPLILSQKNTALLNMQIINGFLFFVNEFYETNPDANYSTFLQELLNMERFDIPLPFTKVERKENAVNFITLFSAKGLEFETVYLISNDESSWKKFAGGDKIFIPPTLTLTKDEADEETDRRLFFVGITRAKKELFVSYSTSKNDSKEAQVATKFLFELLENNTDVLEIPNPVLNNEIATALCQLLTKQEEINPNTLNDNYLADKLKNFKLSASALASYLKCPVSFYYNTIVGVPGQPSDAFGYGNAIHKALEKWYKNRSLHVENKFETLPILLQHFNDEMRNQFYQFTKKQFNSKTEQGILQLTAYYNQNVNKPFVKMVTEYNVSDAVVNGVPIKGIIDKLEIYDGHVDVIDYKTGSANGSSINKYYSKPSEKNVYGGDYLRQMVFYKILLQAKPYNGLPMFKGVFEYIAKDNNDAFISREVQPTNEEVALVTQWITETYNNIINHNFSPGCGKEDCTWCDFVTTNKLNILANDNAES